MFKAILIFVLLWSTAMADLKEKNKKLAAFQKELKRVRGLPVKSIDDLMDNHIGMMEK